MHVISASSAPLLSAPYFPILCSQDVEEDPTALTELLSCLAAAMGPSTPLRRLVVNREALFVLTNGCLIHAERLIEPANAAHVAAKRLAVEWEGTVYTHIVLTPS